MAEYEQRLPIIGMVANLKMRDAGIKCDFWRPMPEKRPQQDVDVPIVIDSCNMPEPLYAARWWARDMAARMR